MGLLGGVDAGRHLSPELLVALPPVLDPHLLHLARSPRVAQHVAQAVHKAALAGRVEGAPPVPGLLEVVLLGQLREGRGGLTSGRD